MGTYNKTVWQDGDIITADKMNNIENGIYSYNEDITNIKADVDSIFIKDKSLNLFDKNTVSNGYIFLHSPGHEGEVQSKSNGAIAYVPIEGAGNYSWVFARDIYGEAMGKIVIMFDENKQYLSKISASVDSNINNVIHFNVTESDISSGAYYFGYTVSDSDIDTAMIVKSSEYPSEYIPYYDNGYVFNGSVSAENVKRLLETIANSTNPISTRVTSIENDLSSLDEEFENLFTLQKGTNLFDKNGEIVSGKTINIQSNAGALENRSSMAVQFVPFDGAGSYSMLYPKNYYGATIKLCLYDSGKNYLRMISGTSDSQEYIASPAHFTISAENAVDVAYVGFTYNLADADEAMVVKSDIYPSDYAPYVEPFYGINGFVDVSKVVNLQSITDPISSSVSELQAKVNGNIGVADVDFISSSENSINLFNKHGEILENRAITVSTGEVISRAGKGVQFIPFKGSGDYTCLYPQNYYGQNTIKLCLYDSEKAYLRSVSGTKTVAENEPNPCNFTISDADSTDVAYIGYCFEISTMADAMFVKASTYPVDYIPYYEAHSTLSPNIIVQAESTPQASLNPLYGKRVFFDGDSIARASGTLGGWAYLIGEGNLMDWHNGSVSGGTITAEVYNSQSGSARHWICRAIDQTHSDYPVLDYLIFEGGTNDADLLTNDQIGTIDPANWTTFDDTTFVGALESLFYKAINYYPTAKIGFIIAQKMGTWGNAGYDAGDSPSNRRRRKFFDVAIDVCKKWGISYIDLWEGSPLCPKLTCYYDSSMTVEENTAAGKAYIDGQHLTQVGYDIISPKIEAWMKTL